MALLQIMLGKKIEDKKSELDGLRATGKELDKREKELESAVEEAGTEEEKRTVEEEVESFVETRDAHQKEVAALEEELNQLRSRQEELNKKMERKTEEVREAVGKVNVSEIEEARKGINEYVRSKGQTRNFTSVEGGALVPVELLTPEKTPEEVVDLKNYVKVVSVNSASGKYPVISKSNGVMNTVAELAANPKLSNPTIKEIDFKVTTRRGYIPLSQEVIDDANYDVTGLIRDEINSQSLNTTNKDIATVLKTATAKAVVGVDGLKDLVNKEIKKVYGVKFIISASLYAELDKLKDNNGRYLLQDSITAASGKQLLGKEVVVLDDTIIGTTAGGLVGFVGDAKSFMSFFDRKRISVEWVDNQIYGKLLAGIVRYDTKKTDEAAGFYITYTNPTTPPVNGRASS